MLQDKVGALPDDGMVTRSAVVGGLPVAGPDAPGWGGGGIPGPHFSEMQQSDAQSDSDLDLSAAVEEEIEAANLQLQSLRQRMKNTS